MQFPHNQKGFRVWGSCATCLLLSLFPSSTAASPRMCVPRLALSLGMQPSQPGAEVSFCLSQPLLASSMSVSSRASQLLLPEPPELSLWVLAPSPPLPNIYQQPPFPPRR